jgi:hypothetical protein
MNKNQKHHYQIGDLIAQTYGFDDDFEVLVPETTGKEPNTSNVVKKVDRNSTMYVVDYLKVVAKDSQRCIFSVKENDIVEVPNLVPKVRKISKIYLIKSLKIYETDGTTLSPVILDKYRCIQNENELFSNRVKENRK